MPRKQNGFGNPNSFAFKKSKSISKGRAKGAAGLYPSDRRYGSSVHRSVIEKYDLDSDWVKWRKGYEYYNRAAWYKLETYNPLTQEYEEAKIESKLYQGTEYEVDVVFTGYKFATTGADSNNHYVMKRETVSTTDLGTITYIQNDERLFPEAKLNREILVGGTAGSDSRLLLQMIGERITDGTTEASLNYVLNDKKHPALYIGKSQPENPVTVTLTCLQSDLDEDLQSYVGKVVYIKDFYKEKAVADVTEIEFIESSYTFDVRVKDQISGLEMQILDPLADDLPPSLYDITSLDVLATTNVIELEINGQYTYDKSLYQRFFGQQYLSADVVEDEVESLSYVVLPYTILGIDQIPGTNQVRINSIPFQGELQMYTNVNDATLSFADWSFTKTDVDEYDGEYYHQLGVPGEEPWMRIDTDVDPWMDEIFTSGMPLKPATMYSCSCPNHSQAILRAPQETEDNQTRRINRQRRYPLPTVLGQNNFAGIGVQQAAGSIESWESREHKMSFKMCKHSIAAMFIEKIKTKEPNKYPTVDTRLAFEEKLNKEMDMVDEKFAASYKRGGITAIEIVFALAQGLNLDDVELAYVVLNSKF